MISGAWVDNTETTRCRSARFPSGTKGIDSSPTPDVLLAQASELLPFDLLIGDQADKPKPGLSTGFHVQSLVAGDGFEPPTFGL